ERKAAFKLGQPEEALLEHIGIDVAALGNEDNADVLGAFVAHILKDRELLVGDELRDRLDQLALGDAVRNFADDKLPGSAGQLFDPAFFPDAIGVLAGRKTRTNAKAAAARFI